MSRGPRVYSPSQQQRRNNSSRIEAIYTKFNQLPLAVKKLVIQKLQESVEAIENGN